MENINMVLLFEEYVITWNKKEKNELIKREYRTNQSQHYMEERKNTAYKKVYALSDSLTCPPPSFFLYNQQMLIQLPLILIFEMEAFAVGLGYESWK